MYNYVAETLSGPGGSASLSPCPYRPMASSGQREVRFLVLNGAPFVFFGDSRAARAFCRALLAAPSVSGAGT